MFKFVWKAGRKGVCPGGDHARQVVRVNTNAAPAQLDITGPDGRTGLGIFESAGDSMKLVIADAGLPRPREFKGDRRGMLFTLRKEQPK